MVGGLRAPGHHCTAGPPLRATPRVLTPPCRVGGSGGAPGARRVGAGTAGAGFGTVWYHRWPRPISGPPAAVSFPGLLVSYGTTDHGKPTAPGGATVAVVHLRQFHNFLGGCTVGQTPNGLGGSGEGVESRRHLTPSEGGEKQRPGSNPCICFSLPNRTPPTCTPRCAMVVPRPPIGRALGATVVHPPPRFRCISCLPS